MEKVKQDLARLLDMIENKVIKNQETLLSEFSNLSNNQNGRQQGTDEFKSKTLEHGDFLKAKSIIENHSTAVACATSKVIVWKNQTNGSTGITLVTPNKKWGWKSFKGILYPCKGNEGMKIDGEAGQFILNLISNLN